MPGRPRCAARSSPPTPTRREPAVSLHRSTTCAGSSSSPRSRSCSTSCATSSTTARHGCTSRCRAWPASRAAQEADMDRIEIMLEPIRVFLRQAADFLPRLALALLILILGYFIARGVKFAIVKGLRAGNFHVLTERAGLDGFLRDGGVRADTTEVLALLFYWLVILAALIIGFNGLGLTYITD